MSDESTALLTTSEVSAELGVPERTLDQWAYRKVGPAYHKIGRHRRYSRADLNAFIAASRHRTDGAA